jgi:thioesterase domain-containing protein/acyl carrier protein
VTHVDASSHFFELGGHSLLAVRMLAALEQELGVSLPVSALVRHPTCGALSAHIDSQRQPSDNGLAAGSEWQPLVLLKQGHGRTPLFCMHAVGGNVLNYRQLANALPVDQPVYALQAIGLDGVTTPLESIEEMSRRYIAAMREVQPHGPYYLCGGSMGGTIAFEVARQLTWAGEPVGLLAMMDTWGPDMRRARSVRPTLGQRVRRILSPRYVLLRLKDRVSSARARRCIAEHQRLQRVIPQDLRWRAVANANVRALNQYFERPYSGSITLICATSSQARGFANLGWDSVATGGIERIVFEGRHDTFVEQPEVAQALSAALSQAQMRFEPASQRSTA